MPSADMYCASTVANAAPDIPKLNTATNRISNPILITADTPRNTNGIVEFPIALKRQAKKLYTDVAIIPANITIKYSFMPPNTLSGTLKNTSI